MYNRKVIILTKHFTAIVSIIVEILIFYALFLQFERIYCGDCISDILCNDMLSFLVITAMSVWLHEFIECVIDFGDRLEKHGEHVWKGSRIIFLEEDNKCPNQTTKAPRRRKSQPAP